MSTLRSRGSDISAVAPLLGSRRISIIVSDSGFPISPRRTSLAFFERRSEPISRIVCGFPAAAGSMTWLMPVMCAVPLNAATTLSTSCHAATAVAAADATTITNAPSRKRLKTPGPV